MGHADRELQRKLIVKYLSLVEGTQPLPEAICFFTDGVKLVVEGSPLISELKKLEQIGVRLLVCQTCLDHFGLTSQVAAGTVGGMGDMVDAQWAADKVITL